MTSNKYTSLVNNPNSVDTLITCIKTSNNIANYLTRYTNIDNYVINPNLDCIEYFKEKKKLEDMKFDRSFIQNYIKDLSKVISRLKYKACKELANEGKYIYKHRELTNSIPINYWDSNTVHVNEEYYILIRKYKMKYFIKKFNNKILGSIINYIYFLPSYL